MENARFVGHIIIWGHRYKMLERDLTSQSGLIAKSIPKDWVWTRIPDLPHKRRGSIGFDGVLWSTQRAYPVEVKIGWAALSESELRVMHQFNELDMKYLILRYFDIDNNWVCEGINDKAVRGDMEYICQILQHG